MAKKTASNHINFEKSLLELEALVADMERGELSLEDALKRFESGIALANACQSALTAAERKIEQLLASHDQDDVVPFDKGE